MPSFKKSLIVEQFQGNYLKSLAASQLVYLLSPLRSNHHAIREIKDMFYHFLWNGKGDKIKRKVMINEPEYGGLKMIDLCSLDKSLKTTWVKKYLDTTNHGKWEFLFDLELTAAISFSVAISMSRTLRKRLEQQTPFLKKYWNIGQKKTLWIK